MLAEDAIKAAVKDYELKKARKDNGGNNGVGAQEGVAQA
jgi:hypothetical protein